MIKVQNNIATRDTLPAFLIGLAPESLADLRWTDPALGVRDLAWLPEVDQTPVLQEGQTYDGTETLTAGDGVVTVVRGIRDLTPEEIHAQWLAANPVPESISYRQGMLELIDSDHIDAVEASIAAIADVKERRKAQAQLDSPVWWRADPFVNAMWGGVIGGTQSALDDMFRRAVLR